jgi:hypothetical protein
MIRINNSPFMASYILHGRTCRPQETRPYDAAVGTPLPPAKACSPETIARELPLIEQAAAGKPYWIDMESRLRAGARDFPVNRAQRVLEVVQGFI